MAGIDAFYEQCRANGVPILKPLMPTDWGTKDFYVEDPDGNIIAFGGRPGRRYLFVHLTAAGAVTDYDTVTR